jgi:ubiquinone/menaquinone biosynthesis C-methylase UbiE
MSFAARVRRFLQALARPGAVSPAGEAAPEPSVARLAAVPGGELLASMTPEELMAWENRDVPSIGRTSDTAEALADEKQDPTSSLNFPLHWTTGEQSWNYLFDFALACELLAPRPDDLVLDFAAGTCWASEFLCRLGVRTVSIDLSVEMMRRGRARLAADSRLVFRDQASFVVARGQSLPFADASFDGVLCMNALHHLPSYTQALREIHRVLKPGGAAVFSEPGTTHASQPLSRFRMREDSVIEKNVSLPHIQRLAIEAGFSRMRIVPLRSSATYVADYAATDADAESLRGMWDDTLRVGPGEHARFVLRKGDGPAADTLLPAAQLIGRLRAGISLEQVTLDIRAGSGFVDHIAVVNTGSVTWKARGRRFGGQVTCGLKICGADGDVVREDLGRTPIPCDVPPGGKLSIEMHVAPGLAPGRYTMRYDMVVEGVTWFEFQGSECVERALEVMA